MNTVSVLVSKCIKKNGVWCSYDGFEKVDFPTLEEARADGEKKRAYGMSVIVRPNYNEVDDGGKFFREWRSFDMDLFTECKWRC